MSVQSSQDSAAMQEIWAKTVESVKQSVIAPALWRALEKAIPVIWEENTFVIGMSGTDAQMAGQLNTTEYQGVIERTLRQLTGINEIRFRVMEGSTIEDWEYTKQRDAAALASRQQAAQKKYVEATTFGTWDEVYDQVSRLWASSEFRSQASGRGRYLDAALNLLEKSLETLYPADRKRDEQAERGLSRVIERIASMTNTDPVVVAYLLFERQKKS